MTTESTIQQQARRAGLLYLLLAISAPVGLLFVPGTILVPGNATATAENLRASEWLLHLGMATDLLHQVIAVFLVLALYRLFKPVDETLAKLVVILGALVSVPIMFVNALNDVAALILVSGADFLAVFSRPQLDALAYLFLRLHEHGVTVASVFWGLWLFPFGALVIRSGFIPRMLGYLLMVAGGAYLVAAFADLVLPRIAPVVGPVALPLEVAELPIVVWLMVWGARTQPERR
ncbi:MAG TPA: DUF4386 domain-containing protein [Polyangiaceae bacterium]|nr:DUF4386 domain-containing protein [Polyangiaceae bacterium]